VALRPTHASAGDATGRSTSAEAAAAAERRRRARRERAPGLPRNVAWLYVLPGLGFYVLFTLAPLVHTAWLSLFDWDGLTVGRFVGLDNYREAFGDSLVRDSFAHSGVLIVFYSLIPVAIGLLLTALLTRHPVRGLTFYRTALFLPQMIAGVVVAQAWVWIYADRGPLNEALRAVGLDDVARPWIGDFDWALPSVGAVGTWVSYGLCMVLFIAGAQKIPQTLYDAARVDGAGPVREFFAVTLPGLRNEIVVALVLTTINALRSFDLIYNVNQGGPGTQTYVPSLLMYQNAFLFNRVGYACAIAVILATAIFALAFVILRVSDRGEAP
jgi:raffinose/stachyose/melibiose transport system permease protein